MFRVILKQYSNRVALLLMGVLFVVSTTAYVATSQRMARTSRNYKTQSVLSDAFYNICRGTRTVATQVVDVLHRNISSGVSGVLGQAPPARHYYVPASVVVAILSVAWTVIIVLLVKQSKQKLAVEWLK